MNLPDLQKLEEHITRNRVDFSDAIGILDAVVKALEYEYGELPQSFMDDYSSFTVSLAALEDKQERGVDECAVARDWLIRRDEEILT